MNEEREGNESGVAGETGEAGGVRGKDGAAHATATLTFTTEQQAVAAGQAVSIYDGDECLGGGFACAM